MQSPRMRVDRDVFNAMGQGWWDVDRHLPTLYVKEYLTQGKVAWQADSHILSLGAAGSVVNAWVLACCELQAMAVFINGVVMVWFYRGRK